MCFCLDNSPAQDSFPPPLPGRSQFPRKREVRKVRTPQGNAPHESEGRATRGTRTDSAAERYRRWSARTQARVKWWSKSPPRIRATGRHGKPRVVQDRTGKGLPARSFPGISRTLRKQGAPPRRSERNGRPASQRVDRIRLTGERHSPARDPFCLGVPEFRQLFAKTPPIGPPLFQQVSLTIKESTVWITTEPTRPPRRNHNTHPADNRC